MRKIIKISLLVVLGIFIGLVAYEAIMFIRIWHLRSTNPASTSLIDARLQEAEAQGQQAKREQVWVSLDKISPNLQRAVLAGEDTNFLTHHGFDYEALQKAWDEGMREAAKTAKQEGENDDWLPTLPDFMLRPGCLQSAGIPDPFQFPAPALAARMPQRSLTIEFRQIGRQM